MAKLKVSFFVHDLADNPVGRTIALANALKSEYDVEVLGFLISDDQVYRPYRDLFEYKTVRCGHGLPNLKRAMKPLYSMCTGDVIYACKPLITSFLPALFAAGFPKQRPLFLDVDDDHWGYPTAKELLQDPFCGARSVDGWAYSRLLHPFTWLLDGATVVSTVLQKRYGGILLRHGPDEKEFDPARPDLLDVKQLRERFGLPQDRKLLLFAGTPRAHKGIYTLQQALLRPESADWDLALVSPLDHPDVLAIRQALGNRCHLLGFRSYTDMPALLAATDAVPLPQMRVPFAEGQLPAKLFDAMSMAKPIIASQVGDLGKVLGEKRGWVIEPNQPEQLAAALAEVSANPTEAAARGSKAREWFLAEACGTVIRDRLHAMIQNSLVRYPAITRR
ncbi:MAG: glycosyltransferase family 4 protein [Acidobacteriota bacterium]